MKELCAWPGCTNEVHGRGFCKPRYNKLRRCGKFPDGKLVDAAPVQARIAAHIACGCSLRSLAALSGCSQRNLDRILNANPPGKVCRWVATSILSVAPPPTDIGTTRRIQALRRMGHPLIDIATSGSTTRDTLKNAIASGHFTFHVRIAVVEAYKALRRRRGSLWGTALQRLEWPEPDAWLYLNIDDPSVSPDQVVDDGEDSEPYDEAMVLRFIAGEVIPGGRNLSEEERLARAEAIRRLTDAGHGPEWISGQVKCTQRTVLRVRSARESRRTESPDGCISPAPRARASHCRGKARHLYTPENTRFDKNGKRHCVECETIYKQTHKRSGRGDRRTTVKIAA